MTSRKPIKEPVDPVRIINAVFAGIVLVMMTYFGVQQRNMGVTVDQVKHQTDGNLTAAKLAVAISAETAAAVTKDPADIKTAKEAREAYNVQKDREHSNP